MPRVKTYSARNLGNASKVTLSVGDLVNVPDGKWDETEDRMGVRGHWAIFVGKKGRYPLVRPIGTDGAPKEAIPVEKVQTWREAVTDTAIDEMLIRRGVKPPSAK
jgi:hypothetical protein